MAEGLPRPIWLTCWRLQAFVGGQRICEISWFNLKENAMVALQMPVRVLAAGMLMSLASCDKQETDTGGTGKLPSADSIKSATQSAQQSANELLAGAKKQLNQGLANSQEMYDKLKTEAAQFDDEKLKGIMANLQAKLDSAKSEIARLKDANEATIKSIQNDVNAALAEVKKLYDEALARIAELRANGPK
jgi:hypothetical protein